METERQLDEALDRARQSAGAFCLLDVRLDPMDRSPALERLARGLAKRLRDPECDSHVKTACGMTGRFPSWRPSCTSRHTMSLKVYSYANCGTCRKALAFLRERGVAFTEVPIRERPPTRPELERMLARYDGDVRRLFNTSGQDYRSLNLKERLPSMSASEAIGLLAANGNLVKRPFVLGERGGAVGFEPEAWRKAGLIE